MADDWMQMTGDPSAWVRPDPLPLPLEGERLVIRPLEPEDGPQVFATIAGSRANLVPWMIWAHTDNTTLSETLYNIERFRREVARPHAIGYVFGIFDKASGEYVGGTGLHNIKPDLHEAETGYWIRADRQRTGLCTEAVGVLITSALRPKSDGGWGLRRIVAFCAARNDASAGVCRRLGMRLELRARRDRYLAAGPVGEEPLGYHDSLGYGVLADEWDFDQKRAKAGIDWDDA